MATLDYLRKWFMYGWEYRELLRNIPSVAMPDDHDVYHGNLWGAGGRDANDVVPALQRGVDGQAQKQDSGGFTMPVDWVNMVQRTQTSHLPDPVRSCSGRAGHRRLLHGACVGRRELRRSSRTASGSPRRRSCCRTRRS